MQVKTLLSILVAGVLAVVFSITTVFLAPLPLLVLRRAYGRWAMISVALLCLAVLSFASPLAVVISFASAVIISVVLSECENSNIGYSASVFVTVTVLIGVGFLLGSFAVHYWGFDPVGFFREQIAQSLLQLKLPTDVVLDKEALLKQVPSALLMLTIFAVWLNSILTPRVEKILGWSPAKQAHCFTSTELVQWRLPVAFVWLALAATAGNFFEFDPIWLKWVCTNVFNVVVMLYFFQGLAVVVNYFNVKKVSPIWRMIGYVLIFTQVFLVVAFLGFIDIWMEFRSRQKTDKSAVA